MAAGAYYVYVHCKPDGTPFYVGKGTAYRNLAIKGRNSFYLNVLNKYGSENIRRFVFPCESELQALSDEKQFIKNLRDDGIELTNLTDGGDGISGHTHAPSVRERISASLLGNRRSIGRKLKPEHIQKIIAANTGKQYVKGRKLSAAHIAAIVSANLGNKYGEGRVMAQATRDKLAVKMMGNKNSLGVVPSEETRAKLSAAAKADWAKRKANKLKGN